MIHLSPPRVHSDPAKRGSFPHPLFLPTLCARCANAQSCMRACRERACFREAEAICQRIADSMDALRRAQAVATMIRKDERLPTGMRHEASTGQLRQPPRLAAAMDPASGMYHTFAIHELRSGDVACGARFHVYITDIFSMRSLLPFQTCWRPSVASFLISLLQQHADAEQQVVVLRALSDAPRLEGYYERIGFTSEQCAFDRAGLSESFVKGDLLFNSEPAGPHEPVSMVEIFSTEISAGSASPVAAFSSLRAHGPALALRPPRPPTAAVEHHSSPPAAIKDVAPLGGCEACARE